MIIFVAFYGPFFGGSFWDFISTILPPFWDPFVRHFLMFLGHVFETLSTAPKRDEKKPKKEGVLHLSRCPPVEAEPTGKRQREQGELEGSLREARVRELETHSLWLSIGC